MRMSWIYVHTCQSLCVQGEVLEGALVGFGDGLRPGNLSLRTRREPPQKSGGGGGDLFDTGANLSGVTVRYGPRVDAMHQVRRRQRRRPPAGTRNVKVEVYAVHAVHGQRRPCRPRSVTRDAPHLRGHPQQHGLVGLLGAFVRFLDALACRVYKH